MPIPSDDLLFLIHNVARLLRIEADKRARRRGMTRAQWVMLIWLDRRPGLSQKELAELLEVEPITVARLVDRMEARGLVERRADPMDRRVWRLHLTPAAAPELCEIARERAEIATLSLGELDRRLVQTMSEGLRRIKAKVGREPERPREDARKEIAR